MNLITIMIVTKNDYVLLHPEFSDTSYKKNSFTSSFCPSKTFFKDMPSMSSGISTPAKSKKVGACNYIRNQFEPHHLKR